MNRIIVVILIGLLLVLGVGGGIYLYRAQDQYVTYTDNDYGFSFKYPKDWHVSVTPKGLRGASILLLANFDPDKLSNLADEKRYIIDILRLDDNYGTPKDIKERIEFLFRGFTGIPIKSIHSFKIENGEGYIISSTILKRGWNIAAYYIVRNGHRTLIYFFPNSLADNDDQGLYVAIYKSMKIKR